MIHAHPDLIDHSAEFSPPRIETIHGFIHVAIGYDLANSVWIDGDGEAIVVDTLGSREAAGRVLAAFREKSRQPVQTLIYTHNHVDHIMGAGVFAEEAEPEIIAQRLLPEFVKRFLNILRPSISARSVRQFGLYLDEPDLVNAGIGPRLHTTAESTLGYRPPTVTFDERYELKRAGLDLRLMHAPGETDDALYVWMPEQRVLISADNIYKTFPNLYAIRGTPYRDVMRWVASLDLIRALRPETLIPMHGPPIHGEVEIYETVTAYRDAIQFIHDQTIRMINLGYTADQIAAELTLPDHLANHRYLRQHYGTVDGAVRSIFSGTLGWFSGNPADLDRLPPAERAERMANLAGGVERLFEQAAQAHQAQDDRWLLELTEHLAMLAPNDPRLRRWRIDAMRRLGEGSMNANLRNYYLMSAKEAAGFQAPTLKPTSTMLSRVPIEAFFETMRVRLNPSKSVKIDRKVRFRFTDSQKTFTVHVRYGVLEVTRDETSPVNATIITTEQAWKEVAAGLLKPGRAVLGGKLRFSGSLPQLIGFLGLIDR